MILADKIMENRKKNGWSQEELADKLGVSRQSVSKWEGAQSIPDMKKIVQLWLNDRVLEKVVRDRGRKTAHGILRDGAYAHHVFIVRVHFLIAVSTMHKRVRGKVKDGCLIRRDELLLRERFKAGCDERYGVPQPVFLRSLKHTHVLRVHLRVILTFGQSLHDLRRIALGVLLPGMVINTVFPGFIRLRLPLVLHGRAVEVHNGRTVQ